MAAPTYSRNVIVALARQLIGEKTASMWKDDPDIYRLIDLAVMDFQVASGGVITTRTTVSSVVGTVEYDWPAQVMWIGKVEFLGKSGAIQPLKKTYSRRMWNKVGANAKTLTNGTPDSCLIEVGRRKLSLHSPPDVASDIILHATPHLNSAVAADAESELPLEYRAAVAFHVASTALEFEGDLARADHFFKHYLRYVEGAKLRAPQDDSDPDYILDEELFDHTNEGVP